MDKNQLEGKWEQLKGKAREQWGKLTDNDLQVIGGKKEQLIGKLQERYGYMKDRAEKEVEAFFTRNHFDKSGMKSDRDYRGTAQHHR